MSLRYFVYFFNILDINFIIESFENVVNYNINYSNHVSIGTTNTYICKINQICKTNQQQNKTNNECAILEMPHNVKKLSFSEQQLTVESMFFIKTHLGYGWRKFFKSLGYTNGQLDQFVENYRIKGIDEVTQFFFLKFNNEKKLQTF